MSSFQLLSLPTGATASALSREVATSFGSAFLDTQAAASRNSLRNDGEGRMYVTVDGQPYGVPQSKLLVVIAGFEHTSFDATRRQYYIKAFGGTGASTNAAPDCYSDDGVTMGSGVSKPQATDGSTCKSCPHFAKAADARYGACQHKKHFLLYLVESNADGSLNVRTDMPLSFAASSVSLFTPVNEITENGGTHKIIPYLIRSGKPFIDRIVFEMDYSSGPKAPLFRPVGALPDNIASQVTTAAKTAEGYSAVYKDAFGVPTVRKATAAPATSQPYSPPQQAQQAVYTPPPAPVHVPPVAAAPVQAYTPPPPPPAPVEQAPVYTPPPAPVPPVAPVATAPAPATQLSAQQEAAVKNAQKMMGLFA